jgi:hypothetical protein
MILITAPTGLSYPYSVFDSAFCAAFRFVSGFAFGFDPVLRFRQYSVRMFCPFSVRPFDDVSNDVVIFVVLSAGC